MRRIACIECRTVVEIKGTKQQWRDFDNKTKNIQDIFPEVPTEERELLLSGLCGKCFDKLFLNMEVL